MHAEAVRYGAMPSKEGLIQDISHPAICAECSIKYHLYYDDEAEPSATLCSILADEIVTARHPEHSNNVVLDLTTFLGHKQQEKSQEVVWSIRTPLLGLLKKKPGIP